MKSRVINQFTRKEIQRKYIDNILGSLDFMQIKGLLKDYLSKEKDKESDYALELEIRKEAPDLLIDNWDETDDSEHMIKTSSQGDYHAKSF